MFKGMLPTPPSHTRRDTYRWEPKQENFLADIKEIANTLLMTPKDFNAQKEIVKLLDHLIKDYKHHIAVNCSFADARLEATQTKHFIRITNRSLIGFELEISIQFPYDEHKHEIIV